MAKSLPLPPLSLDWPLKSVRLTSPFGPRILQGIRGSFHPGLDFGAPTGTPVYAGAAGKVLGAGLGPAGLNPDGSYGIRVVLGHEGGWRTTYNHFSGLAAGLQTGQTVTKGQLIGFIGETGMVKGAHLHLEVLRLGLGGLTKTFYDPKAFLPGGDGPDTAAAWSNGKEIAVTVAKTSGGVIALLVMLAAAYYLARGAAGVVAPVSI